MENVLETGTVRGWQCIDKLGQVALLTTKGCGSNVFRSGGFKLVCILYRTVAAATFHLLWRDEIFSSVLASCSLMIRRVVLWIESSNRRVWHSSRRARRALSHCVPELYRLSLYLCYLVY